ncbi:MAG: type II toxin-antitoxin system HipA family toxin [Sporichthyaceae bacterium]
MTDTRAVAAADVYKGAVLAATLERIDGGVQFGYRAEYLTSGGPAVATGLPLQSRPTISVAGSVPPFFAGLLPEGARLQALTRRVKTSADDMLSLLLAVGSDCIGDVRVVPAGTDPEAVAPLALVTSWDETDFEELFAASVAIGGDTYERTALPGVQEKVSAAMTSFPISGDGASHILKFAPERYPRLVENEAFVMAFAAAVGLPVAPTEIVLDRHGRAGLLVSRFDRARGADGTLLRLAQEDAAQVCGRYPADKYLLTMNQIVASLAEHVDAPLVAVRDLVRLVAFSYLACNGDLHAKNISIHTRTDGLVELSPAYDLLADLPYTGDAHQALQLDGRDLNLTRGGLVQFAERFGVLARATHRELDRICDLAPEWIGRVWEIGLAERPTEHLRRTMTERLDDLGRSR